MLVITCAVWLATVGEEPRIEPGHAGNSVYLEVLDRGLKADGQTVKLPDPQLRDGQTADDQRKALRMVAGSDRRLEELIRNSVTAPYIIKVRDVKTESGTILRRRSLVRGLWGTRSGRRGERGRPLRRQGS